MRLEQHSRTNYGMERVCQKLTVSVIGMNNTYKTLLLVLFTILVFKGTGTARPNVVYIISDDQAFAYFGFMGHPFVKTPHLDKLAEQSAVFPNGYLTASVCRPSLMTLLTGRYQFQHGVHFNHPPPGSQALTNDPNLNKVEYDRIREEACDLIRNTSSLPRILAAKGYRCFQTGKYWEGHWRNAGFTEGMTIAEPSNAKNGNRILATGETETLDWLLAVRPCNPSLSFWTLAARISRSCCGMLPSCPTLPTIHLKSILNSTEIGAFRNMKSHTIPPSVGSTRRWER
jgi:hypothetical protein